MRVNTPGPTAAERAERHPGVPLIDLGAHYRRFRAELEPAIDGVLSSGAYILGESLQAFEQEVAAYLGVRHAIGVASGSDALYLALQAAGIRPGDEIITTPFTFIASVEAILRLGAQPVFADIDPHTFNLDPGEVERLIGPRTRALLPVHLFGQAADLSALADVAQAHDLPIIEDCAQAFGATIGGRRTGSLGLAGCFSFYPTKILGGFGDGGMVTSNSDALAARVRALRNHGNDGGIKEGVVGWNSRLDELQAAILRIKLRHVDELIQERRRVAGWYAGLLGGSGIVTPSEGEGRGHVYNVYTILSRDREAIVSRLTNRGIGHAIYYPAPIYRLPFWPESAAVGSLPRCEAVCEQCLSLPIYPEMNRAQVERVADAICPGTAP